MRKGNNNGLLKNEKDVVIGINFGADFVSEHEWGIDRLKSSFGISDTGFLGKKRYGLEKRTSDKVPNNIKFLDTAKHTVLMIGTYIHDDSKFDPSNYELYRYKDDTKLKTAWDYNSFGVSAVEEEDRKAVRALYKAIQEKNVCIWLGGGGVFENAGLVVCQKDLVPEAGAKALYDADKDREKLLEASEATGIATKLKATGGKCDYLALSPRWAGKDENSKYNVIYWLNPMNQQDNEYGWYTVEELELWALGKGPVIEKSKNYKAQKAREATKLNKNTQEFYDKKRATK